MVYIKYECFFKNGKELEIKKEIPDNITNKKEKFKQEASNVFSLMKDGATCIGITKNQNELVNINLSNLNYLNIVFDDTQEQEELRLKKNEEEKQKAINEMLSPNSLDFSDLFD